MSAHGVCRPRRPYSCDVLRSCLGSAPVTASAGGGLVTAAAPPSPALNLLDRAAPELRSVARAGQTSLLMITGGLRPGARRTVRLTTSSTARRPAVLPETLGVR